MDDSYQLLNNLVEQGKSEQAVALALEMIATRPGDYYPFTAIGMSLMESKSIDSLEEAIAAFENALRLKPDDPNTLYNLAVTLRRSDRLSEAIAILQRLVWIESDSPSADTHFTLANVYKDVERFEEAITEFQISLNIAAGWTDAMNNYGRLLNYMDRFLEAEQVLRSAIDIAPDDADLHRNLAISLNGQDRWESAVWEYRKAYAMSPTYAQAMAFAGDILMERGLYREAEREFQLAIAVNLADQETLKKLRSVQENLIRRN